MPFWIENATRIFPVIAKQHHGRSTRSTVFVYIDDIVIFGATIEEHNEKLVEVFERIRQSNLKLNPKKCSFIQKEVSYLGHRCSEKGVEPDEQLTEAVRTFPRPKNAKDIQSFHGLANYYRKFIKDFANIASPSYKLTKHDEPFVWSKKFKTAFTRLKEADFDKEFTITTDASRVAVGAILEQEGRVIYFASKTLTDMHDGMP